jgi:hypothetical protein
VCHRGSGQSGSFEPLPLFQYGIIEVLLQVDLSRRVEQLGGAMAKHLTDDVQFLIADVPGSEKYRVSPYTRLSRV